MRMFFVLALGRSGTNFLAELLAHDRRGVVHHEPWHQDPRLLLLRHSGGFDEALDGLLAERFERLLAAAGGHEFYGEVNSYLRYEGAWLRRRFDPTLVHLVRDGRAFVRSAWIRDVYTAHDLEGPIVPRDGDPFAARWSSMSRFARLCWCWRHSNERLAADVERFVRFEDMLRDYDAFRAGVAEPAGVDVPRSVWQAAIDRPTNTSREYRLRRRVKGLLLGRRRPSTPEPLPHHSAWDAERAETFWSICGETMERFGYAR